MVIDLTNEWGKEKNLVIKCIQTVYKFLNGSKNVQLFFSVQNFFKKLQKSSIKTNFNVSVDRADALLTRLTIA